MQDALYTFYLNFYTILMATCPVRTGNMQRHIKFFGGSDYIYVKIEAPTERGYDYALAVNEGLAAKFYNRPMTPKEQRNYHWVQRSIQQAAELTAQKVTWEGGTTFEIY